VIQKKIVPRLLGKVGIDPAEGFFGRAAGRPFFLNDCNLGAIFGQVISDGGTDNPSTYNDDSLALAIQATAIWPQTLISKVFPVAPNILT
jgi:hypothetical protein